MSFVRMLYWRQGEQQVNYGDYLNEPILRAYGYQVVGPQDPATCVNEGVLLGAGSVLDSKWLTKYSGPYEVWGSGFWKDPEVTSQHLQKPKYYAVRGPQTERRLKLPYRVAVGDPALLLSMLYPCDLPSSNRTVVAPHWHCLDAMEPEERIRLAGVDSYFSVRHEPGEWAARTIQLATAAFVLAGSLHAAIVAESYGIPWAPYLEPADYRGLDKPAKWLDWFAYLGLRWSQPCKNLDQGQNWWRTRKKQTRLPNRLPLAASFPYPRHDLAVTPLRYA